MPNINHWNKLINGDIEKGWQELVNDYNNDNSKLDNITEKDKEIKLELYGSFRKYLVHNFICSAITTISQKLNIPIKTIRNRNIYQAVGSTNITSDYDVNILGPDSHDIMRIVFNEFYEKNKTVIPYAFDTNLYTTPLCYVPDKINYDLIKDEPFKVYIFQDKQYITLVPKNKKEINVELQFAFMKLYQSIGKTKFNEKLEKYFKVTNNHHKDDDIIAFHTKEKSLNVYFENHNENTISKQQTDDAFYKILNNTKKKDNKYYNNLHVAHDYLEQYKYSKLCTDYVYNRLNKNKSCDMLIEDTSRLFEYCNKSNYWSSEAYYCCSTVNVVVLELQMGIKMNYLEYLNNNKSNNYIIRGIYLSSLLENLSDFLSHIGNHTKDTKEDYQKLIKYSKYIQRIYFSLKRIYEILDVNESKKNKYVSIFNKMTSEIIPLRKIKNITKSHINLMMKIIGIKSISKIKSMLIEILEDELKELVNSEDDCISMLPLKVLLLDTETKSKHKTTRKKSRHSKKNTTRRH